MNEIPNIEGCICEQLLSVDEYIGDEYLGNFGVLLKVTEGKSHRIFFDYGPLFWKQRDELPCFDKTPQLHKRVVEIGAKLNVIGQTVAKVETFEVERIKEIQISFVNDVQIKLIHDWEVWEKQYIYYRSSKNGDWEKLSVI